LGACSVGYPLHHLRCPYQALARSNVNFGPERDPVSRTCPLLEPLPWLASPLPQNLAFFNSRSSSLTRARRLMIQTSSATDRMMKAPTMARIVLNT
jgi:hypothetical protein